MSSMAGNLDLARVELEDAVSEHREFVLEQEVVERRVVRHDMVEQAAQRRDVPLPLLEVLQALPDDVFRAVPEHGDEVAAGGDDPHVGVEDHQRIAHGVGDGLAEPQIARGVAMFVAQFRDIVDRQKKELERAAGAMNLAGVEKHRLGADVRKDVLDLVGLDGGLPRQDLLEQQAQRRNVPLAVAEIVEAAADGSVGRCREHRIEGAVGGNHRQIGVEHQQPVANGLDDILGRYIVQAEIQGRDVELLAGRPSADGSYQRSCKCETADQRQPGQ